MMLISGERRKQREFRRVRRGHVQGIVRRRTGKTGVWGKSAPPDKTTTNQPYPPPPRPPILILPFGREVYAERVFFFRASFHSVVVHINIKFGGAGGQPSCDATWEGSFISQTPVGKSDNIQYDSSQRVYRSIWRYASRSMFVNF